MPFPSVFKASEVSNRIEAPGPVWSRQRETYGMLAARSCQLSGLRPGSAAIDQYPEGIKRVRAHM